MHQPDNKNQSIPDIAAILKNTESILNGAGKEYIPLAQRIGILHARLTEGRFHLAILGQFKRGKSTLLNALLGEPVLPMSIVPLTAVPTFIRHGETEKIHIDFEDNRTPATFSCHSGEEIKTCLAEFVTEEGNPHNHKGVSLVELYYPSKFLDKGVVLIDTPGVGSTFRHNTEQTLNFLHQCDAALFLVSADPPITEVEIAFLRQVRSKVSRIFFILNKIDYLCEEELAVALSFLQKVLEEQAGIDSATPIFCVSARDGLKARKSDDLGLWKTCGMALVERHLMDFLAREKMETLKLALTRTAADVLNEGVMRLHLSLSSLQMPLDELQRRLDLFEEKIEAVQQQRQAAQDLLSGDQRRMHVFLEEQAELLRSRAHAFLDGVLMETFAQDDSLDEFRVQEALAQAVPVFFEHLSGQTSTLFAQQMTLVLQPHQHRADDLIESIRQVAAELFAVPYFAPKSEDAFEMVNEPYWVTHQWTSTLSPIPPKLIDRLLPAEKRKKRIRKRLQENCEGLVIPNVENLRWATFQSIDQTFLRFGSTLDTRLSETIDATYGAIKVALERRKNQSALVNTESQHILKALKELNLVQNELNQTLS